MDYCFTNDYQELNIPPPFPVHVFHPRVCLSATGAPPWLVSLHAGGNGQHNRWLSAGFDPLVELSVGNLGVRVGSCGQGSRKRCRVVPI